MLTVPKIYSLFTILFRPLLVVYLYWRKFIGKEDQLRIGERFGRASLDRPKGKLCWIHAASIGESLSLLPLIKALEMKYPDFNFLITTITVSSTKIITRHIKDFKRTCHQYAVIDDAFSVESFLDHWKPDIAIWAESELWPNMIIKASGKCPIILVNARLSERSFNRWRYIRPILKNILGKFSLILTQTSEDHKRFSHFIRDSRLMLTGHLKWDAEVLPYDQMQYEMLRDNIGKRKLWLAASTHKGEEEIIIHLHKQLKKQFPDLLTIIVPRHAERGNEIESYIRPHRISYATRSKQEQLTDLTEIYLADTMGELGLFYRIARIVFIGGSFIPHGGQNPLEAARLECVIISGLNTYNFKEIYDELFKAGAAIQALSPQMCAETLSMLLALPKKVEDIAKKAQKLSQEKRGTTEKILALIAPFMESNR